MKSETNNLPTSSPLNLNPFNATNGDGTHTNGTHKNGDALIVVSPDVVSQPAVLAQSGKSFDRQTENYKQTERQYGRLRRLWRTIQIVRVLGGLSFFIFLENYESKHKFDVRIAARLRDEAHTRGRIAAFQEWSRDVDRRTLDKLIRLTRRIVFRGHDASASKNARLDAQAKWLGRGLINLGPTFIKIGQSLGTRADLLPLAYVKELSLLQDQVPAFPNAEAHARIVAELGMTMSEAFAEIDDAPVAAASLGQVYRARLHTGEEVAVKVQRPNLDESIAFDLSILEDLTARMSRIPSIAANADWQGMLAEFAQTINEEMNYRHEAANAERFRRNFKEWTNIHVPTIYMSHTTNKVLTMDFIRGTKVTDIPNLKARRISPAKVNRLLIRTYLKQLLEDGFFHADPHPGNLLVMDDGRLAFFDFGMTGRITPRLQSKMIDAFFHVVEKDVHGIADDLFDLQFVKAGYDAELVRPAIEGMFQHYLNLKLGDVNFKELTYELAEVMYDYPFRLPANFTYIIRALMTLEGIGIVTDPDFNFFDTAKPYAKQFMFRRESKQIRQAVVGKILRRETDDTAKVDWRKMWKLTKMAANNYLGKPLVTPKKMPEN
ncbi:MAG: AarF/ABC1/UbiB kinase family protein [Pyrinomonadaceae bacterium MAG19_C2-C3]|nr:AarF/ABC1/UbiB kinase family protein [Pyrinomonadaceae bacterium MAG19_C2-C3]